MGLVFSTIGGSGSSYLISQLKTKYQVGTKPDAVFQDILVPLKIDPGTFSKRSGIDFQPSSNTPKIAISELLQHAATLPNYAVVLNLAHEMELLSELGVVDVNFLIRNPVDAYNSFYSNPRHRPKIEHLGGVNNKSAVDYFMKRWLALTWEYNRLLDGGLRPNLIRYESFVDDVTSIPDLSFLACGFKLPPKRPNTMAQSTKDEMMLRAQSAVSWEIKNDQ